MSRLAELVAYFKNETPPAEKSDETVTETQCVKKDTSQHVEKSAENVTETQCVKKPVVGKKRTHSASSAHRGNNKKAYLLLKRWPKLEK